MPNKSRTVDRSSGNANQQWKTYQRNAFGQYVYLGDGSGITGKKLIDWYTRSWVTYPGWKSFRAANGYLPTQPMTETKINVVAADNIPVYLPWSTSYRIELLTPDYMNVISYTGIVNASGWITYSSSEKIALVNDAKQKCLAKARDLKVHLPVLLGEGRQTVSMLAQTARTLGRAYRNFRRGRFKQAAKELGIPTPGGTAANHWLAYQYGWLPLLSDAKGAYRLLTQGLVDPTRGPRFSVKANSKTGKSGTQTYVGVGSPRWGGDSTYKLENKTTAHAGLLLEVNLQAQGLQSVGLGRYDPLLTAWELTPFSFVFDWFVDIGGFLESLSALEGYTVLAGYSSHVEAITGDITFTGTSDVKAVSNPPKSRVAWRHYSRDSWDGSALVITMPLWDGLNARRLTTTAALWRQRCRGDRVLGKYRP